MTRRSYQRALALSATAVLALFGLTGMAAAAPGGHGTGTSHSHSEGHHAAGHAGGHGHHGNGTGTSHSHGHGHHGAGNSGSNGHHGAGNSGSNGHHGAGNSGSNGNHYGQTGTGPSNSGGTGGGPGSDGSPPGNNGNIKIAGLGDLDGIPNNTPHPGCTFQVEWYGYDEGADVVSTVTFGSQAPTGDVTIAVDGPATVFVGQDPARGGQDIDAVRSYTLSFTGAPHPKQGYHVRLTVHTPHSNGNDTKSKVFWVEPCAAEPAAPSGGDSAPGATSNAPTTDLTPHVLADAKPPLAVRAPVAPPAAVSAAPGVPTAIDAGQDRGGISAVLADVASPLPLALIGCGLLLAVAGVVLRRRGRGQPLA